MDSLNDSIREYTETLKKGRIQRAYRGIMTFMADLRSRIEQDRPELATGALYFGYMDMTYFACTPRELRDQKLKIALVYLHEENRFELWLAAANRQIQARVARQLSGRDLGRHMLMPIKPGEDAIISSVITTQPDFDHPEVLIHFLERELNRFSQEMMNLFRTPWHAADRLLVADRQDKQQSRQEDWIEADPDLTHDQPEERRD